MSRIPRRQLKAQQRRCRHHDFRNEITITQTVLVKGQRKTIDWLIQKVSDDSATRGAATVPAVTASDVPAKPYQVDQQIGSSSVSSRPVTQLEDALRTAMAAAKSCRAVRPRDRVC